jgi:hypothetical protein
MPGKPNIPVSCEQCGKGFLARADKIRKGQDRFCSLSCYMLWRNRVSPMSREKHHQWKGGKTVSPAGYVFIRMERDDPFIEMANQSGYVQEHRLVMARHLGRPLRDDEVIHHADRCKLNNDLSNLVLLDATEHARIHLAIRWHGDADDA